METNHNHPNNEKRSSDRSFGLLFSAIFFAITFWPILEGGSIRLWAVSLAVILLGISMIAPGLLKPANIAWTRFGLLLGRIVNPIVLGFMFFVIVTPIGLLMRLTNKNLLGLKRDRDTQDYWVWRDTAEPNPQTMKNQF